MNWKFILAISLCFFSTSIFAQKDVVVKNAPNINSDGMEFSPVLYQNGLVYVSRHRNGPVDQKTGETFFELFYAELDPNGFPLIPQDFSTELNSQVHEGPVSFNRRGDQIFFTRSNTQDGKTRADSDGRIGLKIYTAQRGYFDWENIQELPFNDNEYTCMHPSLSPNGKKLFFTSNMPGGYGGYDLYFVERIGQAWSMPINLGPDINTAKNEVFPFIHESGVLFFTSDGHSGMGGLDLFMIDLSGRKWGRVINLGEPFNSESDDLGIVLTPGGSRGYFTSNRVDGKGQDDIYFFEAPTGIKGRELYQTLNSVIAVYDKNQSKRVPGAAIRIFETSSDGLINNEDLYNIELLPASAESRELTLKMVRKSDENLGDPRIITDRNGEAVAQFQENKNYIILVSKDGYQSKEIIHVTKDVDAYRPIEVLLEPSNCFSLDGIVTNAKYGQRIPNALVRIVNNCDGSEEIIRTTVDGEFQTCLNVGCEFTITGEKEGYQNDRTKISTVKIRGNRSLTAQLKLLPESEQVMKEPIREGTVIVLENIYYDFNKSAIRSGEARDLEALVKLMRTYPSMEIELGAHTDVRGTEAYNLRLSLKRAESAKQFMVERGIAANRIKAFGYGEAYPRNRCREGIECSEEEHQYNRRTEVRILKMDEPLRVQFQDDFNNYKN